MSLLYKMLLVSFLPVLLMSLLFFVLILELVDLFANLWRYLNHDVPFRDIFRVMLLYLPKCVSFSIPIALLFSISFTLGNFYSNNELISVFGSGISLYQFVLPLIFFSFLLSLGWFFFEEKVVIDSFRRKNDLTSELLKQRTSYNNTNVTVIGPDNRVIYYAEYYNDSSRTLSKVTIISFDENRLFSERVEAEKGEWNGTMWNFSNVRHFYWSGDRQYVTEKYLSVYSDEKFNQRPETFRVTVRNVEEMKREEAREWVQSLRNAGLPYRGALTDYYRRFAFSLTPFIVALISCAIGGRLKKNILLMSLLLSLIISVVYYVMQMVLVLFAQIGYIPPLAGAWGTFLFFLFVSFWIFKNART